MTTTIDVVRCSFVFPSDFLLGWDYKDFFFFPIPLDDLSRKYVREKRDSGLGESHSGQRYTRQDQRLDPLALDPRIESIQNFWLESRRFHPVLTDKAYELLKTAFNLTSVPP